LSDLKENQQILVKIPSTKFRKFPSIGSQVVSSKLAEKGTERNNRSNKRVAQLFEKALDFGRKYSGKT
jgi:hypothetical protein